MDGSNKPIIAITMGDPASIGPEITVKACMDSELYMCCRPLIIGDVLMIQEAINTLGATKLAIHRVEEPEQGNYTYGTIDIISTSSFQSGEIGIGKVSGKAGKAAYDYIEKAIQLALEGRVAATVTNAINKEALKLAGFPFAGHTEIYATLTKSPKYAMLLVHDTLRVVHVSTHVSLREACERVTKERVYEVLQLANQACNELGISNPTIGVAGLNPHAGENGLFGHEEIDSIIPAIQKANEEGLNIEGPIPPDTIFSKAKGGGYDMVIAMYHDQGHIPLKLEGFKYDHTTGAWSEVKGVNITLGLPIIRTSVDHGTAFDQAGKGTASEKSLKNAIMYAVRLAE